MLCCATTPLTRACGAKSAPAVWWKMSCSKRAPRTSSSAWPPTRAPPCTNTLSATKSPRIRPCASSADRLGWISWLLKSTTRAASWICAVAWSPTASSTVSYRVRSSVDAS